MTSTAIGNQGLNARGSTKVYLALTLCVCFFVIECPSRAVYAQTAEAPDVTRQELNEACIRPYPPEPSHYESAAAFNAAKELYYREASIYVSDCIDKWISESRRMYEEMFRAEAESYQRDRQDVLDEMRDSAHSRF